MTKTKSIFLVAIILLFSMSFISATADDYTGSFSQQGAEYFTSGLIINLITPHSSIIGEDLFMYASVYELDGKLQDNNSVDCFFGIISQQGERLYLLTDNSNFTYGLDGKIWVIPIPGDFINEEGIYNYNFDCEGTVRGGYFQGQLHITRTGEILGTSESLIYFILAFGVLLLFLISFYFMISTPYGNDINEKGAVIKITKMKYVKLGLILLSWVLFTWVLNILIGLSDSFVSLTMYYGFFGFMFRTMNAIALPLGVFIIVLALFEIVRDVNIQKAISKFGSSQ